MAVADVPMCRCGRHPVFINKGKPCKLCSVCIWRNIEKLLSECEHGNDVGECKECDELEWQRIRSLSEEEVHQELLDEGFTEEQLEESHRKLMALVDEFKRKHEAENGCD